MVKSKQEQFLELYEPIHDTFERFCRARVYGNMEHGDLINETLLVAFEKFDTLKSKDAFLSFLFGISVRILSNNHKKLKERNLNTDNDDSDRMQAHNNTESDAEIHFLYKALSELNDDQRESLILFEISGFKIKEIASVKTYEPNQLGLYNMSGNVAEIVSTDLLPDSFDFQPLNTDQIVTCGGSWMSAPDELKVYNSHISNNINGHPSIGFRVVITYLAN